MLAGRTRRRREPVVAASPPAELSRCLALRMDAEMEMGYDYATAGRRRSSLFVHRRQHGEGVMETPSVGEAPWYGEGRSQVDMMLADQEDGGDAGVAVNSGHSSEEALLSDSDDSVGRRGGGDGELFSPGKARESSRSWHAVAGGGEQGAPNGAGRGTAAVAKRAVSGLGVSAVTFERSEGGQRHRRTQSAPGGSAALRQVWSGGGGGDGVAGSGGKSRKKTSAVEALLFGRS